MLSHTEDHDEGLTCGPLPNATPTPVISTSCPINDAIKKAKKTREFPIANTHMWAFELPCRAATLRGSLLGWWGRRVRGWWLSQWDWRSWERRIGWPLLLLDLLRDGLVSLRVQVQNLVANVWKTETDFLLKGDEILEEKQEEIRLHQKYLRAAQLGRPGQTAPTSGVTTAWRSTPGCQTYRGGRPNTWRPPR